jgi:hypothetical protein
MHQDIISRSEGVELDGRGRTLSDTHHEEAGGASGGTAMPMPRCT